MSTITTRSGKGSPLTHNEVDANFTNLNTDKLQSGDTAASLTVTSADINGGTIDDTVIGGSTPAAATFSSLVANSLTYPTTDGTSGQAIITDGSGALSFGDVSGGGGITYVTKTANYTTSAGEGVIADTSGGAFTITLPASPSTGDQVIIADGSNWATTNLTVGRNGSTIEGVAADLTCDVEGISVTMVYDGSTWQLYPQTGTSPSLGIDDNATSTAITIDSSQNVGIGTASPAEKINIVGAGGTAKIRFDGDSSNLQNNFIGITGYDDLIIASDEANSGTASTIQFRVDATERMRLDSSGNVGIGTTSPTNFGAGYTTLDIRDSTAGILKLGFDSQASFGSRIQAQNDNGLKLINTEAGAFISFTTVSSERMRIDSSGNVGIGITNPAADLVVAGSNSGEYDALILRNSSGVDTSSTSITFEVSAGTHGTEAATAAKISALREGGGTTGALLFHTTSSGTSAERMRIDSSGNVGIGTTSPAYRLDAQVSDNTWAARVLNTSATDGNGLLVRSDSTNDPIALGVYGNGAYRMVVRADGNVLVGTTSTGGVTGGSSNGAYISGASNSAFSRSTTLNRAQIAFYNPNGLVGQIGTSGSSTYYNTSSDYRLKENVVDLDNGIDRLKQIPVHRFNFIADADTTVDGFIAHEVQDVVPEAITGTKDAVDAEGNPEYQGIDQSKLVPLLTAALQEAVAKIEDLESRLSALEAN